MLKRKIEKYFKFWKENRKTCLLVTGARQIGKTSSINKFIEESFENVIKVDFSTQRHLLLDFAKLKNENDLLLRLSLIGKDKLIKDKTVIFFDEIQILYKYRDELKRKGEIDETYVDLLTLMKPFSIKNEYRFIVSGSLLGVAMKDISLYPLGYIDEIRMFPLDFEEFLWASGVNNEILNYVKKCFDNKIEVDDAVHRNLLNYFDEYVLIGGMPEAVLSYINNKNLYLIDNIHESIYSKYNLDITNYIDDELKKARVRNIYSSLGSELNSKNKRFISSRVIDKQYLKRHDVFDEFIWLIDAGVALPTYNVNEPIIPLAISSERKTLKLFNSDNGLLIHSLVDTRIRENLLNKDQVINFGAPYENAVAMELSAHGYVNKLYYYNSKKNGEVDFLIEHNATVLPIEVKSGKPNEMNIYNHYALNNLIKKYSYKEAYIFGKSNIKKETEIIYLLPIYMIMFIYSSNYRLNID